MKFTLLFALIAILSFSFFANAQDVDRNDSSVNAPPEKVLKEVVSRILIYKFKPAQSPKTVYLAEAGVNQSWLPTIKNIVFRLLSDETVQDREDGVYFFTKPEFTKGNYEISFAFGNPQCNYTGEGWNFRASENKVKLWLAGNMGGGCGSTTELEKPGRLNLYPNELKGYHFFDRDRLKGLFLTVSTKEDVKRIFGENCESYCDYDSKWRINFRYFDNLRKEITVDNKTEKFVSDTQYEGKLYSISFRPKKDILLDKVTFPSKFVKGSSSSASHDGKGGGTNSSHEVYTDRYGLKYTVLDKIILTTVKNLNWRKGELESIEYTIPDKLEEKNFVEQK